MLPSNGEMSEWFKEHAWKLIPLARADAHQNPPTQSHQGLPATSICVDVPRKRRCLCVVSGGMGHSSDTKRLLIYGDTSLRMKHSGASQATTRDDQAAAPDKSSLVVTVTPADRAHEVGFSASRRSV